MADLVLVLLGVYDQGLIAFNLLSELQSCVGWFFLFCFVLISSLPSSFSATFSLRAFQTLWLNQSLSGGLLLWTSGRSRSWIWEQLYLGLLSEPSTWVTWFASQILLFLLCAAILQGCNCFHTVLSHAYWCWNWRLLPKKRHITENPKPMDTSILCIYLFIISYFQLLPNWN